MYSQFPGKILDGVSKAAEVDGQLCTSSAIFKKEFAMITWKYLFK